MDQEHPVFGYFPDKYYGTAVPIYCVVLLSVVAVFIVGFLTVRGELKRCVPEQRGWWGGGPVLVISAHAPRHARLRRSKATRLALNTGTSAKLS